MTDSELELLERLGFEKSVANPGLRWMKYDATKAYITCWVERNAITMVWSVVYWKSFHGSKSEPLTLGSTDLTAALIFAEVEGVTGG